MTIVKLSCALLLSAWMTNTHAAIILAADGKTLAGFTNIQVGTELFDIEFKDGSCASLMGGCDEDSDFLFAPGTIDFHDSNALLIALLEGFRSSFPLPTSGGDHIVGCEFNAASSCSVVIWSSPTLYRTQVNSSIFGTSFFNGPANGDYDTSRSNTESAAVWSRSVLVPEPGTLFMLVLGMVGLGFSRYTKQH